MCHATSVEDVERKRPFADTEIRGDAQQIIMRESVKVGLTSDAVKVQLDIVEILC
jgi:hypothetical protein